VSEGLYRISQIEIARLGENTLNEKRIQQVLDMEKQAQAVYESAVNEARQLPLQAEQEAQALIEKARADAEKEAREMVEKARSETESKRIMDDAQERINKAESLARQHFSRAVTEVLSRVAGKE
jgi:vacuolar-type H+-ATPase subunit H